MTFLRNTWYMAAWADEVTGTELFSRKIIGDSILFFRQEDERIVAIHNRCPHRFAPLSMGTHCGNTVQCAYHGLAFDGSGACIHNPHGNGKIPGAAKVKAYPVEERHLAIWIWMGEPEKADPALIPNYAFLSEAKLNARNTGYLYSKCNYQLLSDNILDFSHVDFLHPKTLGGGALSQSTAKVTELDDNTVHISWETKNAAVPPVFATHMPDPNASGDVWSDVTWSAPAMMHLRAGVAEMGQPHIEGLNTTNLHIMTPECENNSHYFFANTRSFQQDDAEYNAFLDKILISIFANEDKPMVEAQQQMMNGNDFWSLKPLLLQGDAGAVRTRRVLSRLIEQENPLI